MTILYRKVWAAVIFLIFTSLVQAQSFVHPGGLHTQADLDRMKAKVAEEASPWIEGWNKMISDSRAQSSYQPAPRANMGDSRQRAAQDAQAAYLNALRWYISGDPTHAETAVNILNSWSSTVNQVPSGTDQPGLSGIYTFHFAVAAELLRVYPGWAQTDINQFKNMMSTYLYPIVDDFLTNHRDTCITHYWANWDICNIGALIAMGVFLDDATIYNEGIEYFKNGAGNGSISNSVFYLHPNGLGQWQESGRDQPHTTLGVGMMAELCQIAWNQGDDLFGYDNNLLLSGAEYVARTNLSQPVPYEIYDNCDNVNQYWLSQANIGRITRPVWEILYNHYVVLRGLSAPNLERMANLARPENGNVDYLGFGTLAFTLDASASPIKPYAIPPTPTGVKATAGESRVYVEWDMPAETSMQGFAIKRATSIGGPYVTIASWNNNTTPKYTDWDVNNGTTYYYVVAANNKSGTGSNSIEVSATPLAATSSLPSGWSTVDIGTGTFTVNASASYTSASETFIVHGAGADDIGGFTDSFGFTYRQVTGDVSILARQTDGSGYTRMGVMIRESLEPDGRAAFMKKGDVGGRIGGFGARTVIDGALTYTNGNSYTWNNTWFRIDRVGDTFTGYQSSDGVKWHEVASTTIDMTDTIYVGLASSSGSYSQLSDITFDNVTITDPSNLVVPDAPIGLEVNVENTRNTLSWNSVVGARFYTIKRATISGGAYTVIASGLSDSMFIDTGLENGTTYYYVVTSSGFGGESSHSAEVNATPQLSVPSAPENLLVTTFSAQKIDLAWSESPTAETYNVKRATVIGGSYTIIGSPSAAAFSDTNVSASETYYYVVTAVNSLGESSDSDVVSVTPGILGYWKFDESSGTVATDSWVNNNGTVHSGVSWTTGMVNNGIHLDGSSEGYVDLPDDLMSTAGDFTIAAWVKLDTISTWARIFDFGTENNNSMFLAPQTSTSGEGIRFAIKTTSGYPTLSYNYTWPVDTWTHIAVTLSGNTATMYINGDLVSSSTDFTLRPSDLGNTPNNFIGRGQKSSDPMLQGTIDEFMIYARALSASEISNMANNPASPEAPNGLSITGNNNQVSLIWTPVPGATSYNVKRSDESGGSYMSIGNITSTSFNDTSLTDDEVHYYVISAENAYGTSRNSVEVKSSVSGKMNYWKFDESSGILVADSWAEDDGTLLSGASRNSGKVNNGVQFDGSSSGYVDFPDNLMGTIDDFTIATWVKLDTVSTWARIFDFGTENENSMFLVPKTSTSGEGIRFAIKMTSGYPKLSYNYTWPLDTWTHIAVTLSGNTATMYINGDAVTSSANFTKRPYDLGNTHNNFIGKGQKTDDPMLQGAIDEFKIYNRALMASEIKALSAVVDGAYIQLNNRATGLFLDGMGRTSNGDACGQWANTTHYNSHWELIGQGDDYYQLLNLNTGLFLDGMGRTSDGADVSQWANTTHHNSHWKLQLYDGVYYRLQNRATGLYLDGMGRISNGSNCGQWHNTTSANAQWELVSVTSSAKPTSLAKEQVISSSVETTLSIEENAAIAGVEVYPNPVSNKLIIQLREYYSDNTEITLRDTLGKLILSVKAEGRVYELDFSTMSKGVYILTITDNNGSILKKVVKQ